MRLKIQSDTTIRTCVTYRSLGDIAIRSLNEQGEHSYVAMNVGCCVIAEIRSTQDWN
ncbi:MAG: hypothetical protein ACNYPI_05095 [Arenicellales bacterium WSBS_2016_MAG_OTU3]